MKHGAHDGGIKAWIWLALAAAVSVVAASAWVPLFQEGYRPFMKWGTTQGVFREARIVECNRTRKNVSVMPVVRYEYTVDGVHYSGGGFVPGNLCAGVDEVNKAIEGFRAEAPVTVYYSVKKPEYAVLKKGLTSGRILSTWIILIAFVGAIFAYNRAKSRPS